jgi:predicted regulator of Ras-like GTPase activity (Roadblock/LC7/MglB family)
MTKSIPSGIGYRLRSGIAIYPAQEQALQQIVADLLNRLPARFILLSDVAGQIICAKGEHEGINLVALSSLMAGDLAASQEIARLTGEYQDYQLILREGQTSHTVISEAGQNLVVLAQVAHEVPLGWVRLQMQQAVHQLAEQMEIPGANMDDIPLPLENTGDESLEDLFGDALEAMWEVQG